MPGIGEQVRRNSVALISLAIALAALGYTTWRNERTEQNHNVREAGFELLSEIGSLQQVVFYAHFNAGDARGDARMGWADVLTIQDLAALMPPAVGREAEELRDAWQDGWEALGTSDAAHEKIDSAIDTLRQTTLASLRELD
ncbi:MAG: hypothetical protein ACT4UQ_01145 [Gammaproteobacteria bacterium]